MGLLRSAEGRGSSGVEAEQVLSASSSTEAVVDDRESHAQQAAAELLLTRKVPAHPPMIARPAAGRDGPHVQTLGSRLYSCRRFWDHCVTRHASRQSRCVRLPSSPCGRRSARVRPTARQRLRRRRCRRRPGVSAVLVSCSTHPPSSKRSPRNDLRLRFGGFALLRKSSSSSSSRGSLRTRSVLSKPAARSISLSSSPRSSHTPRHAGQWSISMPWRSAMTSRVLSTGHFIAANRPRARGLERLRGERAGDAQLRPR